jgi:FdrA protein
MAAAAADPRVRVLLLDVVLGHGAHDDPAGAHAPVAERALATATADGRPFDVVVSLVGTSGDPQGLQRQVDRFVEAGCHVHASNAAAARAAGALATGEP